MNPFERDIQRAAACGDRARQLQRRLMAVLYIARRFIAQLIEIGRQSLIENYAQFAGHLDRIFSGKIDVLLRRVPVASVRSGEEPDHRSPRRRAPQPVSQPHLIFDQLKILPLNWKQGGE